MKWLITGGAGFIGTNAARRLLAEEHRVVLLDNLSRRGAAPNLEWLRHQGDIAFVNADVRNFDALKQACQAHKDIDVVLHLAAQVAVTTSVVNPREDFEINALGTFNVCESVRQFLPEAVLLNASTNKVYGAMDDLSVVERNGRYEYASYRKGVPESRPLDFHSPYGCSKGSADQYVRDYARIYGIRTVSFRQSCIYGPHQFGIEDQGWVAWLAICAVRGKPITIYGDGKQVRDVLFVEDLVDCYLKAVERIEEVSGHNFNVGGGPENTLSLLELVGLLEGLLEKKVAYSFGEWRPGDQRVFVCDVSKAAKELGWRPRVAVSEGVTRLVTWVQENKELLAKVV